MRKHFLILMLLALLPLSSWAATVQVKVYPIDFDKSYGDADMQPTVTFATGVTTDMFYCDQNLDNEVLEAIANKLTVNRIDEGEDYSTTGYRFRLAKTQAGNLEYPANSGNYYQIIPQGEAKVYVSKRDISTLTDGTDIEIDLINPQYVDGTNQIKPAASDFNVVINTFGVAGLGNLVYDTDYVIDHYGTPNNTVAGGGTIFIAGKGNFTGTKELHFDISGVNIADGGVITYIGAPLTFNNGTDDIEPTVADFKLMYKGTEIPAAANWQIKAGAYNGDTYKDNVNAGQGKVTIEGIGDYSGEIEATFDIAQFQVAANGLTVDKEDPLYNGTALKPIIGAGGVKVTANNWQLTEDDYEIVTTTDNINKGNYTSTIKFKSDGNYKGSSQALAYRILPRSLAAAANLVNVDVTTADIEYTGSAITPQYVLKVKGTDVDPENAYVLQLNKDFNIVQTYNTNAYDGNAEHKSTIKFVATNNGNFTGETAETKYEIAKATLTVTPNDVDASFGSSIIPTVTVTGWKTAADEATGYTGEPAYTYLGTGTTVYVESADKPTAIGTYQINVTTGTLAVASGNYQFEIDGDHPSAVLTINAGEILVKIISQSRDYGLTTAFSPVLQYVSGLSDDDKAAFHPNTDIANVSYKILNSQNQDVTATGIQNLNVGSYTIHAVPTSGNAFTYENYNVIIQDATLAINQRDISALTVTFDTQAADVENIQDGEYDYTYSGLAKEPGFKVKLNVNNDVDNTDNAQFTIEWVNNVNADVDELATWAAMPTTTTAQKNAKRAYYLENIAHLKLTATSTGNFKNAKDDAYFTISKGYLKITANEGTWTYGDTEPTSTWTYTIDKSTLAEIDKNTNFTNANSKAEHHFGGNLAVKRTSATGTSVGEYYDDNVIFANKVGLIPYGLTSRNYELDMHAGKLTINQGQLVLKVKDYNEKYGKAYNTDNFELEYVSGLSDEKKAGWAALVEGVVTYQAVEEDGETVIPDEFIPTAVGGTMKLKAEGATSTNYNITLQLGTYTVVKRPIALKLKNQSIQLGEDIKRDNSVTDDIITLVTPLDDNEFIAAEGDNLNKLIEDGDIVVTIEPAGAELNATGEAQVGVIRATIDHAKYVLDEEHSVWGNLTVHEADPLVISSTDENVLETIEGYNGASNIAVKFEGRSLNLGKWNVMVLPFDVTPYEFTQVLGRYAIFNTLKSANTANNTVSFGLELSELKANEPFLVKPEAKANDNATSIPVTDNTRKFEARTIVYPANGVPVKDDVAGVKFYGAYKAFNLEVAEGTADAEGFVDDGGEAGSKIMYLASGAFVTATNTAKTKSMKTLPVTFTRGYLDFTESGMSNARIFVEEADGTTTAINGISADGTLIEADGWYSVNGVKLQNAPVEKGVYIHNGKKVVVK